MMILRPPDSCETTRDNHRRTLVVITADGETPMVLEAVRLR